MSKQIQFYGASDDLVEVEGFVRDEFDGCGKHANFVLYSPSRNERIRVTVSYETSNAGTWMIGLSQVDEDDKMPEWDFTWGIHSRGYSMLLTIVVPDDTVFNYEGSIRN